jgi:hypothetical protein
MRGGGFGGAVAVTRAREKTLEYQKRFLPVPNDRTGPATGQVFHADMVKTAGGVL